MKVAVKQVVVSGLVCGLCCGWLCAPLVADDWDANDATFDPRIQSVVVGEASWLGDPSPFVHTGIQRTGYTYVSLTHYDGFPASIQLSLMLPMKAGESSPPPSTMLMMDKTQTLAFVKEFEKAVNQKDAAPDTRVVIKTVYKDADWTLTIPTDNGQRYLQLEQKVVEKVHAYRLSINASKKLLGAIEHSLKKLDAVPD